jgi:hypothetical protein
VQRREPSVTVAAGGYLVFGVAITALASPALGALAFGVGRVLGVLVNSALLDRSLRRSITFSYRPTLPWLTVGVALCLGSGLPPVGRVVLALVALLVLALPGPRAQAFGLVRAVLPGRGKAG